ncbi:MAG: hypoxanthine phosphoribosyltransferase [Prevotella sp.]|jgi:hypoxanthine phosphoribosyltransferase|uniref:Hypoxanthine phosphoribosyltransferase n=1 Tax=Segatella cerevisiae TaxID=2053716 RepID=A0ABT1C170_9BACT|nr:hypoxanthine phosphoribosyltransferase [Segatella cerevisiae]MCH3994531.1 hypoxanthine phosphoribosyltransferase [Prevotella sp.]MCI1247084.1 hypoxanthine phosphoribosyltransferase [Prevotella sp.]MCO6026368.1 hypoxanthine phosphoribosyltransferase [Segatella cerevisiae]
MSVVKIKDKTFKTSIPESEIRKRIQVVADRLNKDMADKNPIFLAVLNGSYIFAADLTRMLTIPFEISFVKLSSYEGTSTTGKVKELVGINRDLKGRTVIILEDIVETGLTMQHMIETLQACGPESVHICTLLVKPDKLTIPLNIEYSVIKIPNDFILGYGLDYDQQGRGLRDIYTLVDEKKD